MVGQAKSHCGTGRLVFLDEGPLCAQESRSGGNFNRNWAADHVTAASTRVVILRGGCQHKLWQTTAGRTNNRQRIEGRH